MKRRYIRFGNAKLKVFRGKRCKTIRRFKKGAFTNVIQAEISPEVTKYVCTIYYDKAHKLKNEFEAYSGKELLWKYKQFSSMEEFDFLRDYWK